jgi:hypothetical protein
VRESGNVSCTTTCGNGEREGEREGGRLGRREGRHGSQSGRKMKDEASLSIEAVGLVQASHEPSSSTPRTP